MATRAQIDANRRNAQKSTGPNTPEGKARSSRNGLRHGLTAKTCMLVGEDPDALLDLLEELREKYDPRDTDEEFLIERMAKARCRYNRIMPLEAAIFNLRLAVDKAPEPLVAAQGDAAQRAWAYMRDANGGNALSKLSRYETSLLREYDRCRVELEKIQKVRAAQPAPPPTSENCEVNPIQPLTGVLPLTSKPAGAAHRPPCSSALSRRTISLSLLPSSIRFRRK